MYSEQLAANPIREFAQKKKTKKKQKQRIIEEAAWPSGQGDELVTGWSWVQVLHPATHWICSRSP